MTTPENKGNLITRRAFADEYGQREGRTAAFCRVTTKARSTAYQMMEEVGEFGSGTPSPLHILCELIRAAEELDRAEGGGVSHAHELAEYPLMFLRQLRAGRGRDADSTQKFNFMLKSATDANFLLKGRRLEDVPPGELKEIGQLLLNVNTVALELEMIIDDQLGAHNFPGAPVQRERPYKLAPAEG